MKIVKTVCITATIIIALLGWGKYQPLIKKYNNLQKEFKEYKVNKKYLIDSLTLNNIQFEHYYCATENLLDSIFINYKWPDNINSYNYYEAVENIYIYNEHMYNYLESLRKKEKYK